ncbi:MAG: hypothetical protein Q7T11_03630 [Deltaproteobacteria bacterium]|nr:hypothetical protein [Deltaproteobacteria bacterium]
MRRWLFLWLLAFVLGCAAATDSTDDPSAGPPAPPAEVPIPSVIKFPETIEIDAVSPSGSLSALMGMREVADGGEFSAVIQEGEDLTAAINAFNDAVLVVWDGLEIPVEYTRTTYRTSRIKIDFADFDMDSDGDDEGCTGCTCPTGCDSECPETAALADLEPVCYRLWNLNLETDDFEPLLAGRMDFLPPEDGNPGTGEYRALLLTETSDGTPDLRSVAVEYDHVNDDDDDFKDNDVAMVRYLLEDDLETITQEERIHAQTTQETVAAFSDIQKTTILDYLTFNESGTLTDYIDYAARFFATGDFWRGTIDVPGYAFTNQCVDLTTGNAAADENSAVCQALDVSDINLDSDSITIDDAAFPTVEEFPNDPTF